MVGTLPAIGAIVYECRIGELDARDPEAAAFAAEHGFETQRPVRMQFLDSGPDPAAMTVRVMVPVKKTVASLDNVTLDDLSFIVGEWRGEFEGSRLLERWSAPLGKSMLGAFQLVDEEGDVQFYELMAIQKNEDGVYWIVRHFSGASAATLVNSPS